MKPYDYDPNLVETMYSSVAFIIDSDQFDERLPADADDAIQGWFGELDEAKAAAQKAADASGYDVEIEAYGKWGHYGREFIEGIKAQPAAPEKEGA